MWKLGNLEIKGRVVLAPMAGITSEGYRTFMNPFGCALCFTEMVSDMGILYDNKETIDYVKFNRTNVPTGLQLFGYSPENLAKSAIKCLDINPNIDFIDVNMACPVNKVTKSKSGSYLMSDPLLAGTIIRKLKETVNVPITAKIRLGYDSINFLEVIEQLQLAGVDAISIHPRTRKELYYGTPHYELVKDLRNKMKVPLIISGNIFTLEDAINALEITKADAVMIARGGIGNPLLITEINSYLNGNHSKKEYNFEEQKRLCIELAKLLVEEKGELKAMRIYRGIGPKFFSGFPNAKKLRTKIAVELSNFDSLIKILDEYIFEKPII